MPLVNELTSWRKVEEISYKVPSFPIKIYQLVCIHIQTLSLSLSCLLRLWIKFQTPNPPLVICIPLLWPSQGFHPYNSPLFPLHQPLLKSSHGFLSVSLYRHCYCQGSHWAPWYQTQSLHLSISYWSLSNSQQSWQFSPQMALAFSDTTHFSSYVNGCSFLVSPVFSSVLQYWVAVWAPPFLHLYTLPWWCHLVPSLKYHLWANDLQTYSFNSDF